MLVLLVTDIVLTSGDIVFIEDSAQVTGFSSGVGYYTYTGSITLTGDISALEYSGGTVSGFTYRDEFLYSQGIVTAAFYHTRGTTNPIPASGDYEFIFATDISSRVKVILTVPLSRCRN